MATKKTSKAPTGQRVKATTSKAGITRSRSRRYGCGGKLKK